LTTGFRLIDCASGPKLNLDVDAGGELQAHERVHRLRGRVEDADQALVRADLELLPRVLASAVGGSMCGERITQNFSIAEGTGV